MLIILILYWLLSSIAIDILMGGKDMDKKLRVFLFLVWPIILPFLGFMYLLVVTES